MTSQEKLITKDDLTEENVYKHSDHLKCKCTIRISSNLGCVRFNGRLSAKNSIIAEAGSGIKAGHGIEAGDGIEAGLGIGAGWGIKAGSGIKAGWGIKAGLGIEAGSGIEAGYGIKAGYGIEAGYGINAGYGIKAGDGIISGLASWTSRAAITANWIDTPKRICAGFNQETEQPINAEIRNGEVLLGKKKGKDEVENERI